MPQIVSCIAGESKYNWPIETGKKNQSLLSFNYQEE